MRLVVTTPVEIVVDADGVRSLRAEDATGWFGLRPGHADFLTVLVPSVASWIGADGRERFIALRGGVLSVQDGTRIEIASREAFVGDDLDTLDHALTAAVARARDRQAEARTGLAHLEAAALRQIERYLDSGKGER